MNTILIKINSYAQKAQLFINGQEPSAYSELANYTYQQFIQTPAAVLDAIARELNDDFALSVCGNPFEILLFRAAAAQNSYCSDCTGASATLSLSSQERAARLKKYMKAKAFSVQIDPAFGAFDTLFFGNQTVAFSATALSADLQLCSADSNALVVQNGISIAFPADNMTQELIAAVCETLLINPAIGQAVASVCDPTPEILLCSRTEPIVTVELPEQIECGEALFPSIAAYPAGSPTPSLVFLASNPDVLSVSGGKITAKTPGIAVLHAHLSGENKPFFSQQVAVIKTIYASKLQIDCCGDNMQEGTSVQLSATVFPPDAQDANWLEWSSSDPSVIEIRNGQLIAKSPGSCEVTAKAKQTSASKRVTVQAALRKLTLSERAISTNVGRRVPIKVSLEPVNAHNGEYSWKTSDNSVAVVEAVDGQEYIKAVGIGTCTLTCVSKDGSIEDTCDVTVESMMYKKDKAAPIKAFLAIAIVVGLAYFGLTMIPTDASKDPGGSVSGSGSGSAGNQGSTAEEQYYDFSAPLPDALQTEFENFALQELQKAADENVTSSLEKITVAPKIIASGYLTTGDPETIVKNYIYNLKLQNAAIVIGTYTYEYWGTPHVVQPKHMVYLFPNLVSKNGMITYESDSVTDFYFGEVKSMEDISEWLEREFPGVQAVLEDK